MEHTGYVYIWYDTKAKFWYIGGHHGNVSDRYVCSSKTMLRAYKIRPHTFKFKVLEYVSGNHSDVRAAEQRWLNKIKDCKLLNTQNVQNGTCRYYNVKKHSSGGNGKGTNKGKSHSAWNKGMQLSKEYCEKISKSLTGRKLSPEHKEQMRKAKSMARYNNKYCAIDPQGNQYIFENLNGFCKQHGLNQGNMHSVITGKLKSTKGWRCERHPL